VFGLLAKWCDHFILLRLKPIQTEILHILEKNIKKKTQRVCIVKQYRLNLQMSGRVEKQSLTAKTQKSKYINKNKEKKQNE